LNSCWSKCCILVHYPWFPSSFLAFPTSIISCSICNGELKCTHHRYISEEDLLRFMGPNEVARALPLFDGALETGKITPQALKSYVVSSR
jgi:hypothetical protein